MYKKNKLTDILLVALHKAASDFLVYPIEHNSGADFAVILEG